MIATLPMLSAGPVIASQMCRRRITADLHGEAMRQFRTQPDTGHGALYTYCSRCVHLEQIPPKAGDPASPGQSKLYGCNAGDDPDVVEFSREVTVGQIKEDVNDKGCPGFIEREASTDVDSTQTTREARRRIQAGGIDDWDDAPNLEYGGREMYEDNLRTDYKALAEQAKSALAPLRSADRSELGQQIDDGFPQFAIDWLNSHEEYAIADRLRSLFSEFLNSNDYRDFDLRGRRWAALHRADMVKEVPGEVAFLDDPLAAEDPQTEPVIDPQQQQAPAQPEPELKLDPERYIWRHHNYDPTEHHHQRFNHRLRDGRVFEWDDPPFDGHPGSLEGCRCWSEAIILSKRCPICGRAPSASPDNDDALLTSLFR